LFGAVVGSFGKAEMGEVYRGYTSLVATNGELRSPVWGFSLVLKGSTASRSN
jgi:hypothetical protein